VDYIGEHLKVHLDVFNNFNKDAYLYVQLKVVFLNAGNRDIADGDWKIYFNK